MDDAAVRVPSVRVTKMHGARNDFIVTDARAAAAVDLPAFARWACDRHAGVGADGLIVLEKSNVADAAMRTINPDGSEAEMCGNGIRCAARWLHEAGEGERISFQTEAGIVLTEIVACEPEYLVRVVMGSPRISRAVLPAVGEAYVVDLGNPHVVALRADVDGVNLPAMAEELQAAFPGGTNVHVAASIGDGALRVRHWERGAGMTMACGTGAVACAAVAIEKRIVASPVDVFVPGGKLVVEWEGGIAALTGPAVRVFDTEVSAYGDGGR